MKIFKKLFESTSGSQQLARDRVLLVQSDEADAARCTAALNQANFEVVRAANCAESFNRLTIGSGYQALITDFYLPDGDAMELLGYVREHTPDTVAIVLADEVDESLLLKAMAAGASYCIPKAESQGEQLIRLIKLSLEQHQGLKALADQEPTPRAAMRGSRSDLPPIEYKGQLSATTIPHLLRTFYQQQSTGALHINLESEVTSLYFVDGAIVSAGSTSSDHQLGERMVKANRITPEQLASAEQHMQSSGLRFSTALTSLGLIRLDELKPLVVQHILKLLYSIFDWQSGEFVFEHGSRLENEVMLSLSTADVIFAGIRHLADTSLIERWLGDCDRILFPTSDPLSLFQALTLRPEESAVLERFNRPMSVNQVRQLAIDVDPLVVSRTLCGLMETGLLLPFETKEERLVVEMPKFAEIFDSAPLLPDFDARGAAEFCYEVELTLQKFRSGNNYAILAVPFDASHEQITGAYRELAKKFHPDRHSQLASYNLNLKTDLKAIFERLAEAYYSLSDEARRDAYNKTIAPPVAPPVPESRPVSVPLKQGTRPLPTIIPGLPGSEEYDEALAYYGRREFDKARKALLLAIEEDPENPEFRVALARSMLKIPVYIRQAEDAYLKAIELAPDNAEYCAELGLLYQQFSQVTQARDMMQRALQLDPTNPIAQRMKL